MQTSLDRSLLSSLRSWRQDLAEMSSNEKADSENAATEASTSGRPRREINWFTTLWHLHIHIFALYGVLVVFRDAKLATTIFAFIVGFCSWIGVTTGAHRLWAHRSYSASLPLRLFLLLCQTTSCTGSVYNWVLEHRVHHKYHGTDNDPFNHKRGFLYAHLLGRVATRPSNWDELVKQVDMSDIEADRLLMYQKRFYWLLMPVMGILTPVNWPLEYWGEDVLPSLLVAFVLRYVIVTHATWLIVSSIRVWGLDPEKNYSYDTNLVFLVNLSMWPHYHYLLPWDYQTDEYGSYCSGITTGLIRAWAAVGWATDLRTVDTQGVRKAVERSVHEGKGIVELVEEEACLYSERIKDEHLLHRPQVF